MLDFIAITQGQLRTSFLGSDGDVSVRMLTNEEQVAIEDFFFAQKGFRIALPDSSTAIVVPEKLIKDAHLSDFSRTIEFAMAILCESGMELIQFAAIMDGMRCTSAISLISADTKSPKYPATITSQAICQWISLVFQVRQRTKDRLHITSDRFVRYCKGGDSPDALVDLCISLESLIEAETEISFRFSICLAKLEIENKRTETNNLLMLLYSVRSKIVHGADSAKELGKLKPHLDQLHSASRTILTKYLLHLGSHSKEDWKAHLKNSLLN